MAWEGSGRPLDRSGPGLIRAGPKYYAILDAFGGVPEPFWPVGAREGQDGLGASMGQYWPVWARPVQKGLI